MSAIDAALRNLSTLAGLPRFAVQAVVRVQAGEQPAPLASDNPDGGEDASEPTAQDRVSIMPGIEWASEADPERFDAMTWAQRGEWCDTAQRAVQEALDTLRAVETREPPHNRTALYVCKALREDVFADTARQPVVAQYRLTDGTTAQIIAFDFVLHMVLGSYSKSAEPAGPDTRTTLERFYARQGHAERLEKWSSGKACVGIMRLALEYIETRAAAPAATIMSVEHAGSHYVQAPKLLSGISWAFGTDGQKVGEPEPAEVVDGDEYRQAPKMVRYVSRSLGLVPDGRLKQQLLPVETTTDALAVRVLADSQAVVSGIGGKVALLLSVLSPQGGGLRRMTVTELCRQLWPAAARAGQLRDRQAALKAVVALSNLFVVLPNTVTFRLWDIAAPIAQAPQGDLPITFGWSKNAEAHELGGMGIGMLRGRFLLNLSGAMRLSADHALELRTYLHAAAGWNEARRDGRFTADLAPKGTTEELAMRVNALSAPAVQWLAEAGKCGRRQATSDDRRRLMLALERLEEEAKLVRLERGRRGELRLLPPDELLEAYELMRKHGARAAK